MSSHVSTRHVSPRKNTRRPRRDAAAEAQPPTIVEHPDGYYWVAEGDLGEFGPFESYELARADRDATSEEAIAPGETLRKDEQSLGMAGWTDAETEEPAEGSSSPPHLPPE